MHILTQNIGVYTIERGIIIGNEYRKTLNSFLSHAFPDLEVDGDFICK
jgi:hypothetical protein